MNQSAPPVRSFGRLAKAALTHEAWPAEATVQPRSLAALLSRLDRDLELDWLNARPEVQTALSAALGCTVADLRVGAWPTKSDDDATRRIRLHDARYARALDLLDEPLPPGTPPRLAHPESWGRLWWHAPSGSGRSLVGRWLAARGLAFVQSPEQPQARRPSYLELDESLCDIDLTPWAHSGVCIAAGFLDEAFAARHGFEVITSPPLDECLPDIVRWMAERLPADGHFDVDVALDWLRRLRPFAEAEHTFGTIVGLCGALDELGPRSCLGRSPAELLDKIVKTRLLEARERGSGDAGWLARHVSDAFMPFIQRALSDGGNALGTARRLEDWLELVPEELRRGPDLDWMRLSLARADSALSPREVERAARRIPPGAFRILRALKAAGLLVETSADTLQLRPHFLVKLAEQVAFEGLLAGSGFEWGHALLSRQTQARAMNACLTRILAREDVSLDTAELDVEESPAAAAALEAELRCAGLALIRGRNLDPQSLLELWEAGRQLWLELPDDLLLPRLSYQDAGQPAPLVDGWFHLALLAISELICNELGSKSLGKPSEHSPWSGEPLKLTPRLLDSIAAALDGTYRDVKLHGGALALVDRARRLSGRSWDAKEQWHPLELPGRVLEMAELGRGSWAHLHEVRAEDRAGLQAMVTDAALGLAAFARATLNAWRDAGAPSLQDTLLDPAEPSALEYWHFADPALLIAAIEREGERAVAALSVASPEALDEVTRKLAELPPRTRAALWTALPAARVRTLLDGSAPLPADGAEVAWQLAAPAVERAIRRWLYADPERAVAWILAAPPRELQRALEPLTRFERLDRVPAVTLDRLRRHLHQTLRRRPRETQLVYATLARLEREAFPRLSPA